jgi:hypothetical protein
MTYTMLFIQAACFAHVFLDLMIDENEFCPEKF